MSILKYLLVFPSHDITVTATITPVEQTITGISDLIVGLSNANTITTIHNK